MADVFVSYSRRDSDLVNRVVSSLQERGKEVWLDVEGIRDAEVFPAVLRSAIGASDGFVFVISPDSVESPYCEQEVSHALELNKRIVPVLYRRVPDERIPEPVRERNWIPLEPDGSFQEGVQRLVQALETDLDWARAHTRWLLKALEWDAEKRDGSFHLRGAELVAAERWLGGAEGKDPEPTHLQREYILASRAASSRRLRVLVGASLAVAAVSVALLVFALISRQDAIVQKDSASRASRLALARQLGAQSVIEPRLDRAMLLARAAVDLDRSRDTAGTLLSTLLRAPAAVATFTVPIDSRPLALSLSPDGRRLVVNDNNGNQRLYDTRTQRESRAPLRAHGGGLIPALFTPDGRDMVVFAEPSGDRPGGWELRDARTLRVRRTMRVSRRFATTKNTPVTPAFISRDGRNFFFVWSEELPGGRSGDTYVERRSLATGRLTVRRLDHGMVGAGTTPYGRVVILGSSRATTLDGRTLRRLDSTRFARPTTQDALGVVRPDGALAAIGTLSGVLTMVDLRSGRTWRPPAVHEGAIQNLGFAPDGRTLVTLGQDSRVVVRDPAKGEPVERFAGHGSRALGLAFSRDGRTLFTCSLDGAIFEWDLGNRRRFGRTFRVRASRDDFGTPPPLAIAPDGSALAMRPRRDRVAIVDGTTLRPRRTFRAVSGSDAVLGLAWSPAVARLAVAGPHGGVALWDVQDQPLLETTTRGAKGASQAAAFDPAGRAVAAVTAVGDPGFPGGPVDGWLGVWNAADGRPLFKPRRLRALGQSVAFSRDGRFLAAGLVDGRVLLLDARSGRLIRTLRPMSDARSLAFSPDGTLATGAWVGVVQRWQPRTGVQLGHPVQVAAGPVESLSFDRTGATFATTGGADGSTKLWSTRNLQQYGSTLTPPAQLSGSAAFTRDGRFLMSIFLDGRGHVWPVSLDGWARHACAVAGRQFTREEWRRFVGGGRPYRRVCARS